MISLVFFLAQKSKILIVDYKEIQSSLLHSSYIDLIFILFFPSKSRVLNVEMELVLFSLFSVIIFSRVDIHDWLFSNKS